MKNDPLPLFVLFLFMAFFVFEEDVKDEGKEEPQVVTGENKKTAKLSKPHRTQ